MRFRGEWVAQALVESFFVVMSILLALAVDQWSENRQYAEVADQSLGIFEQEIRLNQSRLEDVAPFHMGIRDLLGQAMDAPDASMDLRSIMEGIELPVTLNTAWETALATGALTHMDVSTVSALSLTYSMQERFLASSGRDRPRIPSIVDRADPLVHERMHEAHDYMVSLTRGEAELMTVYREALLMISQNRRAKNGADSVAPVDPRDSAHP
ncbi:MAG TPA: hypothetical protein VJ997_10140 [Longimicrobiales bacterium]|nr:hypothetical protein [Longimicrobiales bacterium]